ncbi:hypothetical protein [Paenibacillus cremeus]|uniref:Uncharacterized protein n=1 Tax=Paenibacillus cremeus TaxID=2163881 RepID=A0A559K072_9BACL|nr:hypothetical protein [Paenibacillus cremeus]TVY05544.1 hypothetical protein FPZ49_29615 [Paenibacillus cremeus]
MKKTLPPPLLTLIALLLAFSLWPGLAAATAAAQEEPAAEKPVLIYDVNQERVVGAFPNAPDIRQEAAKWLGKAKHISTKVKIGYDSGIIVRIPFEPLLQVTQADKTYNCRDLFVIIPAADRKKEHPQLLAFSAEDETFIYECKLSELKPFLEKHDLMHWLLNRLKKGSHPAVNPWATAPWERY